MAPSSEYDGLLQIALLNFRQRFHDRVPLELKHFSAFSEEGNIHEFAKSERKVTLSELLMSLSELEDLDEVKVSEVVQEFSKGVEDMINECIKRHKVYKAEAETLVEKKIADLCNDFKMSLEAKIFLNPQMDVASIQNYFEKGTSIALGSFELQWHHGNQEFFESQKGKLIRKIVKLEVDILEKQKSLLEEYSEASTPVYDLNGKNSETIAFFDNEEDIPGSEKTSETIEDSSNVNDILANDSPRRRRDDSEGKRNGLLQISSEGTTEDFNKNRDEEFDGAFEIDQTNVKVEADSPNLSIRTDIFEKDDNDDALEREPVKVHLSSGGMNAMHSLSEKSQRSEKRKHSDLHKTPDSKATSSKRLRLEESSKQKSSKAKNEDKYHPLIFRLASDNITVGTRMDESFTKLKREFPVVGINDWGNLVYGTSALDPNCDSRWSLMSFLGASPPKKKITFIMSNKVISQDLNLEFFLGFLLKNMKDYAENQLKRTFDTAVITVPSWFCSLHRTQVKDAAIVAGFGEVKLMNQETVGAIAYVLTRNSKEENRQLDIMALAENFGIVSAILYEWKWGKLRMIADEHKIHSGVLGKEGTNSTKRRQIVYDHYISLRSLLRRNHLSKVDKLLFMTDSQEWMKIFMKVSEKLQYSYDGDEILPSSEIYGASALCKKPMEEIREMLREQLTTSVRLSRQGQLSSSPFRYLSKIIPAKTRVPKRVESEMPLKLFRKDDKPTVCQENLISRKMVTLGELDFKKNWFGKDDSREISVLSQITDEGIFVFDGVKMKVRKSRRSENLSKEEITWHSPSLGDGERGELKQLMHSIMQLNREAQTHEYFVVV